MDAHEDYVWPRATSELILLPVTGLECVGERLLAGEGPDVLVYTLDFGGHLRMMKRVQNLLGHYLIHGFRVRPEPNGDLDLEAMVAVFGSKGLRIVKIGWGQGRFRELWRSGLWNMSDWIWDARWLEGNMALALGHNSVVLYDPVVGCILQDVPCTDRCTLSSACLIGDTWKELTIVAGAISNQLLVWYPAAALTDNKPVAPDRRVSGHVGVIFSMSYLESKGLLATASEDRSVRIWKVGDLRVPGGRVQNIGHCFGHSARVWQVKLLENYLISAGEDCVCLVWSHEGEILQAFRGHQGRGIRAIAAHERQAWVITGGDDSGIRLWHLVGRGYPDSGVSALCFKSCSRPGALKAVTLAGSWRVLAVTDTGALYLYDLEVKCWEQLLEDKCFQSYCLLEAAPGPEGFGLCAMANGEGHVKVVPINTPTAAVDLTLFHGKVHSLSWALRGYEELLLLASGPGGVVACLEISAAPSGKAIFVKERCRYLLPPSKQRWHTCSAFLPSGDFLVCGDRRGSVLLFPSRPDLLKDLGVGGKVGAGTGALGTGRDGAYYQLLVRGGQLQPVLRQKSCRVRAVAVWGTGTPGGPQDPRPGLTAHVVSAGGRAEMHCFTVMVSPDPSTPSRLACHVMHLSSHRLDEYWDRQRNRHRMIKVDPETRYMSLAVCELDRPGLGPLVAAACSDGAVRLFLLQDSGQRLQLLAETFHHKRCVLKVHSFTHEATNQQRRLFLCSAATDGSLAFWDLTTVLDHGCPALEPPADPGLPYRLGSPCLTLQAHSCGVNSLHTLPTREGHLVASGSEDGSLHVFVLTVEVPELEEAVGGAELVPQLQVLEEYSLPCAHAAHVTGLKILSPSLMVSASIDQRLTFWRLGHGEPTFMNSTVYHVADVADMDCWPVSPEFGHRCALGGQGLEVYNWYD
ncbi:tRNA (34-2'-O)-methyltransferase regulator WDR6 isoform X4 [Kogia breviceps]|uniref:tRNA (34-2'-O)-methyltransferase regulator WDR6 isoform X4 n=1 Tax=Kogia breviceps TaxID=27615 RepID=UPI0034D17389